MRKVECLGSFGMLKVIPVLQGGLRQGHAKVIIIELRRIQRNKGTVISGAPEARFLTIVILPWQSPSPPFSVAIARMEQS